jgi:hypothetical protein
MKGRKQQLKGGSEWDVLYGRAHYCYLSRAGVARSIKRGMNKRERKEAQAVVMDELLGTHAETPRQTLYIDSGRTIEPD